MAGSGDRNETLLANHEEEEADDLYNDDADDDLDNDDDDDDYYLHHKDDHHDDDDDGSSDDDNTMDDHSSTVQRRAGTYLKDRETKLVQKRINNKSTAAKEAARTANCTGYIVLTSLLVMGITLAFITYYYMTASQENNSQAQFMMSAQDIVTNSNENAQHLYESLQVISKLFSAAVDDSTVAATAAAAMNSSSATSALEAMPTPLLPNVTLPDFEAFAMAARNTTGALLIAYAPLIGSAKHDRNGATSTTASTTTIGSSATLAAVATAAALEQRLAWEQYALSQGADWILRGHLFHPDTSALFASTTTATDATTDGTSSTTIPVAAENMTAAQRLQQQHAAQDVVLSSIMAPIPPEIWRYNPDTSIDEVETGIPPYAPAWQLSPPPYDNSIVNFNYMSRAAYAKLVAATLGETTTSTTTTTTTTNNNTQQEKQAPEEQPLWQEQQWLLSEPFDTRLIYGSALPKNPSDQNYKSVYDLTPVPIEDEDDKGDEEDETVATTATTSTTHQQEYEWDGQEPLASPQSILVVPIVASLIGSTALGSVGSIDNSDNPYNVVAGHISAAIPWTTVFFTNLVPREKDKGPLHVVVNSCNGMQIHTYEVQGVNARYVGPGDLHEPEQTKMGYTATLNPYMPPPPPTFNLTDLRLRLDQLQNQTISNRNGTIANATQLQADLQAILQSEERKRNNKNQTAAAALTKNEAAASHNNGLICQHVLTIYPTAEYADSHTSNDPTVYTIALVCIISFAVFLFLVYDFVVRRQQNKVLGEAERSNAIIASLFPTQVARKLFDHAGGHAVPVGGAQGGGRGTDAAIGNSDHGARGGRKHRSRNSGGGPGGSSSDLDPSAMMNKGGMGGRPIAELFPEATVMFADIAGFTAWSSIREPTQVFELLEAIFQSFDTIANRRGVFKVETVGDCYVAVCGVPEPCADHAVVMARFARECLSKCEKVLQSLELKLGPDTGDLAMRFGLNSGPVTAGVLRGDRARFQLFGDTVNTAARIESTGKRERIHLSESTANLIIASGKPDWVTPREEPVEAKGKGLMNTFWLEVRGQITTDDGEIMRQEGVPEQRKIAKSSKPKKSQSTRSDSDVPVAEIPAAIGQAKGTSRKIQRLIDWNSELLLQLLKHVVARRNALAGRRTTQAALTAMASNIGEGATVVEEVTEVIMLPDFDNVKVDPESVVLTPEVVEQCKSYVSLIASMYRENPFHNFEHASHVTMSVSKLLSRIIAPHIERDNLGDDKHEELLLHDHTYGITSDPLTQFSVVLSALIHDVDHRGVPNFLLCKEDPDMAALYKEKSVAEQNSVDLAWHCLMSEGFESLRCCIFADISELRRFRQLLVNSVIATDIFDKDQSTLRKKRWDKAFAVNTSAGHAETKTDINRKATIVIEHIIQASDVAHTMQHWHVYQKWNERLFEEMYSSFLTGRSDKDPSEGWFNGEIWFFDNYVIPLAKKLKECGVFGVSSDEYLNYALDNRREWAAKGGEVVSRLVKKFSNNNHGDGKLNEEKMKKDAKPNPKEVQDLAKTLAFGRQFK